MRRETLSTYRVYIRTDRYDIAVSDDVFFPESCIVYKNGGQTTFGGRCRPRLVVHRTDDVRIIDIGVPLKTASFQRREFARRVFRTIYANTCLAFFAPSASLNVPKPLPRRYPSYTHCPCTRTRTFFSKNGRKRPGVGRGNGRCFASHGDGLGIAASADFSIFITSRPTISGNRFFSARVTFRISRLFQPGPLYNTRYDNTDRFER